MMLVLVTMEHVVVLNVEHITMTVIADKQTKANEGCELLKENV